MKKINIIILGVLLTVIITESILIFCFIQDGNNKVKLLENEILIKNDFFSQRLKTVQENKIEEKKKEKEAAEYAIKNNTIDPYQSNFYFDKNEILSIENIISKDTFLDSLTANIMMYLKYYNINVVKEELVSNYLKVNKIIEGENILLGSNPLESCISNINDEVIFCSDTYIETIIQKILSDKKSEKIVETNLGNNLNYSILDAPVIIWVGKDYKEMNETYEWFSVDGKDKFTVPKNIHTVLLIGYDKNNFYINDPTKESTVKVERTILEKSYDSYGRQQVKMYNDRTGLFK